jgi:hypothetical protein
MMNRKTLKKLKESGRLKEYARKVAKVMKEGNFEDKYNRNAEDLYGVDGILSFLDDPEVAKRVGGVDAPPAADGMAPDINVDPDAFSASGVGDNGSRERNPYRAPDMGDIEDLDAYAVDDDATKAGEYDPDATKTGITMPGIKKRGSISADDFKSLEELDMEQREELRRRKSEDMQEGTYNVSVDAANAEDAAEIANDTVGEEGWDEISDEYGSDVFDNPMKEEYDPYDYLSDLEGPSDKELDDIDREIAAMDREEADFDWFADRERPEEDGYDKDNPLFEDSENMEFDENLYYGESVTHSDAFEDGMYHHRLRESASDKEYKQKKTFESWGKFWNDRS